MPRILLVGNYAPDRQVSMLAYARLLHDGLCARGVEARLIAPTPILGRLPVLRKWFRYVDKFILFLPRLIKEARRADLVHVCDHSNALYVRWIERRPHVLTCHDLIAVRSAWGEIPENPVRFTGRVLQRLVASGIRRARRIVSVSATTTEDLIAKAGVPYERIDTIESGLNYPYRPVEPEQAVTRLERLGVSGRAAYLLHVGSTCFYKNHPGLFRIFAYLRNELPALRLVTVSPAFDRRLSALIREMGLGPHLLSLSSVDSEDLRALYSRAEALIFPSLMEGFGWPVIEAQACGCPVFASNRPPIPYVGGAAGVYFDPERPREAAGIIYQNWARRDEMRAAGLDNVRSRFTADRMIDRYLSLYGRVLDGRSVQGS